jgi:hypothetical protein
MPSEQVVTQAAVTTQTDSVDSGVQMQTSATGVTAASATAAQTESGMSISEPAAGRVQSSNSERVVAESAIRTSSAELGTSQKVETPTANGRATLAGISTEVTDVTGREAAVPVAPSRSEGPRLQVDMPATRQDAVTQTGLLQSGSDGGETADSGQQSRQDGQNAAAASALAARSGQGAAASSATTGPTFAQQLQQQLAEPRWGQQVGERAIMMAQHGPRTAHIQLDPPELGAMQIRIHLQGQDQVSVSFTSANPAVRDALEQQLPRLREMFADQGLNLQDSSVSDEARRQGSGQREQAEGFGRSGGYGSAEGPDAEALPVPAVALGLVDYYA